MAQTNSEYWEQRIANSTWATYNSLEEKNRALLEMYQEASLNIQEELYQVAQKIDNGKGVTLTDMYKFNRLKSLKANFESIMRKLGEDVEKFGKDNINEGFNKVYDNVMAELGQTDYALPNEKLMEEMMNRPWDGGNFSSRLWKNTQMLASNLNELLTIGLQQGKTVTEIAINLNNRMNQGFNVAHRLVRTETMHYLNESAFTAYKDGGCEEVELWAAQDERTCDICGARHGTKYKLKDRPVLPLHVNCRCTYLPVIDIKNVNNNNNNVSNNGNNDIIKERITRNPEYKVNNAYLNTDEYARKFEGLGGGKIKHSTLKYTKEIIKENNKLNSETMAIIDSEGKLISKQKTGAFGGLVDVSYLSKMDENSVIVTHNHPMSSSFSEYDIALLLNNSQIKTIIAGGHDGTVYKLSVGNGIRLGISSLTNENDVIQEYRRLLNVLGDSNSVVDALVKKYNWNYEVK